MNTKTNFDAEKQVKNKAVGLANRHELLQVAQSTLAKKDLPWKDQHRTVWCSRSLRHGSYDGTAGSAGKVEVYRNAERNGASITGLNRCGNLHTCPVCSSKVGELRRKQLSAGSVSQIRQGGTVYLLTFTFPHEATDKIEGLMDMLEKARKKFQNDPFWKKIRQQKNCKGYVTSLEFTVSLENGWHPHIHMLVFCDKQAFGEGAPANEFGDLRSASIDELAKRWVNILFKVGLGDQSKLTDMLAHAFNVRGGEKAAEYIAKFGRDEKWGASAELAKSHAKIGAAGEKWGVPHFTPFQLLIWAGQGDGWAVHRFREYAEAVEGKKALVWSRGLKAALGVADEDEEVWAATDDTPLPDQVRVGQLTADQFAVILSRKHLPQFLRYVAECCDTQEHLDEYIDMLYDVGKVASGALLVKNWGGGKSMVKA